MKSNRSGQRGFTLVEIIFVLAIILTLVAIFLPLATSKLTEANETKAQADQDALAAAMTAFFSDLRIWPASDGTSNNNQSLRVLLVGDGGATLTSQNPNVVGAGWPAAPGVCPRILESNVVPTGSCATIANAFNHLVINNPNANATEDSTADGDYRSSTSGSRRRWKGPYLAKMGADPFGSNYVINIGAVANVAGIGALERGWILSAGTNGDLDTAATDTSLISDDIGFIFCTRCR